MASKSSAPQSHSSSKQKRFLICLLLLVSLSLFFFMIMEKQKIVHVTTTTSMLQVDDHDDSTRPPWFDVIAKDISHKNNIKIGLVNVNGEFNGNVYEQLDSLHSPKVETYSINFDHVDKNLKWEDFFPEWIDEDEKWGKPKCPNMPMPILKNYHDLDVVLATVPCGTNEGAGEKAGVRDLFRLQVNLVVANLAVESGWVTKLESDQKNVYVVFVGSCGPMVEIFKCDDLLMHQGEYWVYKPDLKRLKQIMLMPVGSCQLATSYAETGKELWRSPTMNHDSTMHVPKLAYVTVLHSSEAYVCGAIALAQSILQTNRNIAQTIDLVLLADSSIGPKSSRGLEAAGWKIKRIQRILSPFAKKSAYNRWNYSKLRMWQLTMYDKIIFIDSDLLILNNIDHFFAYPQLSAAPNDLSIFNSGLMIVEPSQCMFKYMMEKTSKVQPYNGGDQGFLNEIFTWWHRLPSKLNVLKSFKRQGANETHEVPKNVYAIHYLGLKPWMCYRDYDCNWDMQDRQLFASDSAHEKWWQVYDNMPKELQSYCALTKQMNERILKMRKRAKNASFVDGHWMIEVKDPRKDEILF